MRLHAAAPRPVQRLAPVVIVTLMSSTYRHASRSRTPAAISCPICVCTALSKSKQNDVCKEAGSYEPLRESYTIKFRDVSTLLIAVELRLIALRP